MTDNLAIWHKLDKPPATALKTIGGGRLKGKSDINPQWRYEALTSVFGQCGIGWKFTIERLWTEQGDSREVFAFAQVNLYTKVQVDDKLWIWSEPIQGIGGSMLIQSEGFGEKQHLYNNDEAFKMCVTDALGTAMKMLGVAAEVYKGNWDGTKYKETPDEAAKRQKKDHEDGQKASGNQALADKTMELLGKIMPQGTAALQQAWGTLSKEARQAVVACCGEQWDRMKAEAAKRGS